jgi:DNA polymerase-1
MKYAKHNTMNQNQKTILIDSSNLLHRVVWIAESVKADVNPSYIFLTSVKKYADKFNTSNIYSVWDKRLVPTEKNYRATLSGGEYKGNRDKKRNEAVYKHEQLTSDILTTLGIRNIYPGVLEGDDVIAWLCSKIQGEKIIVSADQDMLQLIDNKTIVYSPIKDIIINNKNFQQITGVERNQFIRYKALMGDKSDNIPGLPKCGPKTAVRLISECPDDKLLLAKLGKKTLEPYFRNLKLVDLEYGIKKHPGDIKIYNEQYNTLKKTNVCFDKFKTMCSTYNMSKILDNMHIWREAFGRKELANTLESIVNSLNLK